MNDDEPTNLGVLLFLLAVLALATWKLFDLIWLGFEHAIFNG